MNEYRLDLAMAEDWTPLRNLCRLTEERWSDHKLSSDDFMFMGHLRSTETGPLIVLYKNGVDTKVVRALNMSLGGVKIVAQKAFERGQSFELSLILGDEILECKGDVVYCEPANTNHGYHVSGVKFRDLSFNDWKVLESFFESPAEQEGGGA